MTEQQQSIPTDKEAEQEFKETEQAFEAGNKAIAAQQSGEPTKEETAKKYQDILIALGFTRYDNKEKGIAYKLKLGSLLLGRTFTEKYPIGNMYVSCLVDCEQGKKGEFLKRDECKKIPQVALFYEIRDGKLPIPKPTVIGKVVGKTEKAVEIQFEEFGQSRTETWGFGALKKNEEGVTYVPASYSKETEKYKPKMRASRNIILNDYEAELKTAPLTTQTDTTKEKDAEQRTEGINEQKPEDREREKPEHTTMGNIIKRETTENTELITKYVNLIAEVIEIVEAENRIPSRQKGYSAKYVFDEVVEELKKRKGGNQEGA